MIKERWKYTSLHALTDFPFLQSELDTVEVPALPFEISGRLVFINNHLDSSKTFLPHGVTFTPTKPMFPHDNPLLDKMIEPAAAVNITFPKDMLVAHPIDCVFIVTDKAKASAMHTYHLIDIESHASVILLMRFMGETEAAYVSNIQTEINLEKDSKLTLYHLQAQGKNAYHIENIAVKQAENSHLSIHSLSLGAQLARMDLNTHYCEKNAASKMYGVYHVREKQHVDYHLDAYHLNEYCQTVQHVKGCVDDNARAVFNGRVVVKKGAIKSSSEQSHHGLLLSRRARIDAKPELEIDCDDVKCTHGATVGSLNKDALFYLMSRGVEESFAKNMLQRAHVSSLLDTIESPDMKAYMQEQLYA